jgi:hypothetical protein
MLRDRMAAVQEELVRLEGLCEFEFGCGVLMKPSVVLRQALLHALILCIRMLVPHPVRCCPQLALMHCLLP